MARTFYRATRIDSDGEPYNPHPNDGWAPSTMFEHPDLDYVEHWIFHQRMNDPDAEFDVVEVTEADLDFSSPE